MPVTDTKERLIKLSGVFVYQGKTLALHDVNIDIHAGEFVYLIGKTGSGKSSLLKTLYADLPVHQGEGYVNGFALQSLKPDSIYKLRRTLGIIFQDFQLLMDRTVDENLLFVLKATGWKNQSEMLKRKDEVLSKVGLHTKGHRMPHELSGGEQQRVVIARALLNNPPLILADEPTGNLDPDTSEEIMNLLMKINREMNTALLMATHNYLLIEKFPGKILKCVAGQIKEEMSIAMK